MAKPEQIDAGQVERPDMSAEQAADLARLTRGAAEPDAEVQQMADAEAAAEVQAEQSLVEKNAAGLSMVFALAVPAFAMVGFPTVAGVLANPVQDMAGNLTDMTGAQTLAAAWAPVLAKYGVDLSSMGDKYRVEIAAVFGSIGVGKALYAALKADSTKGKNAAARAVETQAGNPVPKAPENVVLGTVPNE
jgi:hypothetical protein